MIQRAIMFTAEGDDEQHQAGGDQRADPAAR